MERLTEHEIARLLEHGSWVRTLALTLTRDEERAMDLEQRAWEITLKQPSGKITDARKWFSGVLRNLGIMQWREERRRTRREQIVASHHTGLETGSNAEPTPAEIQERIETARILTTCLSDLDEPYRTALYLRFHEDLKVREVAQRLAIPESTAQYRITKGIQSLRFQMQDKIGSDWNASCLALAGPTAIPIKTALLSTILMTTPIKLGISTLILALASLWILRLDKDSPEVGHPVLESPPLLSSLGKEDHVSTIPMSETTTGSQEVFREEGGWNTASKELASQESMVVEVLDAYGLTPLEGAEVFLMTEEEVTEAIALHADWRIWDWEYRFDVAAEATLTSSDGIVTFPHSSSALFLGARTENRFGFMEVAGREQVSQEPLVILAERPLHQDVLVIDEHGQPMEGALVGYSQQMPDFSATAEATARTDAEGHAQLRHLKPSYLVNSIVPNSNTIALLTPARNPQCVELAAEDIGRSVIEFRMPPVTRVHLTCSWTGGEPLADGTEVFLQAVGRKPEHHPSIALGAHGARTKDGKVLLEGVENGMELEVKVQSPFGAGFLAQRVWAANTRSEVSQLSVEFTLPTETRRWRLQWPDGSPLTGVPLQVVSRKYEHEPDSHGRTHSYISWKPTTDADGILTLDLTEPRRKGAGLLPIALSGISDTVEAQWIRLMQLDLNQTQATDSIPTITVGERLIASGVVLNEQGAPVANHPVSLQVVKAGFHPADHPLSLPAIGYAHVKTNERGEFRFLGGPDLSGKILHLRYRSESATVGKWKQATDDLGVTLGTEGFEIRIPTTYRIEGRILLDDPAWFMELIAQGRYPTLTPGQNRWGERGFLDHRNGQFNIPVEDLRDFFVELRQYKADVSIEVMALPSLDSISPDGVIQLPDLDLRGRLYRHVIRHRLPNGVQPHLISLFDETGRNVAAVLPGRELIYFSTLASVPLRFQAEGIQPVVANISGETEVILELEQPEEE